MPGEGTKGRDVYREGNQGSDGVQVSPMVTGVGHNEQPGDLESGEGAHVTPCIYCRHNMTFEMSLFFWSLMFTVHFYCLFHFCLLSISLALAT